MSIRTIHLKLYTNTFKFSVTSEEEEEEEEEEKGESGDEPMDGDLAAGMISEPIFLDKH